MWRKYETLARALPQGAVLYVCPLDVDELVADAGREFGWGAARQKLAKENIFLDYWTIDYHPVRVMTAEPVINDNQEELA